MRQFLNGTFETFLTVSDIMTTNTSAIARTWSDAQADMASRQLENAHLASAAWLDLSMTALRVSSPENYLQAVHGGSMALPELFGELVESGGELQAQARADLAELWESWGVPGWPVDVGAGTAAGEVDVPLARPRTETRRATARRAT